MQQQKWNELDELIIVIILWCYKIIFVMKISDNWEFWEKKNGIRYLLNTSIL